MKLVLGSNGTFLTETGYSLLGVPAGDLRIAYVTTAAKGARDPSFVMRHKEAMRAKGYQFEEIDIEGKSKDDLRKLIAGKNVIHVEGGNTFYLLKAVRESGFDEVIREAIARGVAYAGTSAGAYLACPTIEMATWSINGKNTYGVTDYAALHLVPFIVKAHYTDDQAPLVKEKIASCKYPVRILRDGQGIFVNGGDVRLVGEGSETVLK